MIKIKLNVFYVTSQKRVYICWEKVPGYIEYKIFKNNKLLIEDNSEFFRPRVFDNDHDTELFKDQTRNWLCYYDSDVQDFQEYTYNIIGMGGVSMANCESQIAHVYTQ